MDSKRRMIDIHLQDRPDYLELDQTGRLQLITLHFKCDNVGVYKHSKLAEFYCGGAVDFKDFVSTVNADEKRLEILAPGKIWIRDFVRDTWGTLSAGNNLGVSCYKLLVKHNLLERFISEYPNSIDLKSFREAITGGRLDLPLPQGRGRPGAENGVSEEYEGQGRGRPGTININSSISRSKDINNAENPFIKKLKKKIPVNNLLEVSDIAFEADIQKAIDELDIKGHRDPQKHLLEMAEGANWLKVSWSEFIEAVTSGAVDDVPF